MSVLNQTSFTKAVSCEVVRCYCAVRKTVAPPRKKHYCLGFFLLLSSASPILRDKMLRIVVLWLDRVGLQCQLISSNVITASGRRPTVVESPINVEFDFLRWSGLRDSDDTARLTGSYSAVCADW